MPNSKQPIPTPLFLRWQRVNQRLIPVLAVLLGIGVAWRLWKEAPRVTAIGQVDIQTVDVRSPASGEDVNVLKGAPVSPRLYDPVAAGQVIAHVRKASGDIVDVIAPIDGRIVKLGARAGESVFDGEKLFSIAANHGTSITTYVRSDQPMRPEPGMEVNIREQSSAGSDWRAVIERVGAQYERVPAAQLHDRKAEEWGLPVVIALPQNANLKPGELVYIGWLPGVGLNPSK